MSLRSAMRKYAAGGDVTNAVPDYSRANDAFGGAGGVNDLRNQFLSMGLDENAIGSLFSKYYTPETSQPAPQTTTPSDPIPYSPGEGGRGIPTSDPLPDPRYEEQRRTDPLKERPVMPEIYPEDYAGPRTTSPTQTQEIGPRTSYRINDDGSRTEIGYDGQPVANYTPEQLAMHNATTGVTPSEYRYVWNGQGYDKLPNGPQIGYNPDFRKEQQEAEDRKRQQESIDRQRADEDYYFKMRDAQKYEEPIAPQMPYYPDMPMPETYIEPEVNFPTDPGFYQPPVDYYNPSPPMDFTQDPGILQPTEPVYNPVSKRGGDLAKLVVSLA
jgi:hypothetical protein